MNYADIRPIDVANGPGVRTSIFVSGCTHHCKECFNPETWDFAYGQPFGGEQKQEILDCLSKPYIRGLSLLGGEPFEPQNQRAVLELVRAVRARFPEKDIWCYSGYLFPRLAAGEVGQHSREILELLERYGVRRCYYGHLHAESHRLALQGDWHGIEFQLVSADYVNFRPVKILD